MNPAHTSNQLTPVPTACQEEISQSVMRGYPTICSVSVFLKIHVLCWMRSKAKEPEDLGPIVGKYLFLGQPHSSFYSVFLFFLLDILSPASYSKACVSRGWLHRHCHLLRFHCHFLPPVPLSLSPAPFPVMTQSAPHSDFGCHWQRPQSSPQILCSAKPLSAETTTYSCMMGIITIFLMIFFEVESLCWSKKIYSLSCLHFFLLLSLVSLGSSPLP